MADYALIIGGKRVDTVEFNVDGLKEYTTIQVLSVAL
jgi:hypothetical protein